MYFGSCVNPLVNIQSSSLENDIAFLFYILDSQFLKADCKKELQTIKEFFCIYSYQPCDTSGKAIFPSRTQCEYLRDIACPDEWSLLSSGEYASLLPSCEQLRYINASEFNCSFNNGNFLNAVVVCYLYFYVLQYLLEPLIPYQQTQVLATPVEDCVRMFNTVVHSALVI